MSQQSLTRNFNKLTAGRQKRFMRSKTRILVVEDDTPLAMLMVNMLCRVGCDVLVASNGRKGMELAQEQEFDLIALDVYLPDLNAFDICTEVKQRHISRRTPVVFISAQASKEDVRRSVEVGAVDYIQKPFEPADFIYRIISHARIKRLEAAAIPS
jgi:DNA-binding response OmpR family regulator